MRSSRNKRFQRSELGQLYQPIKRDQAASLVNKANCRGLCYLRQISRIFESWRTDRKKPQLLEKYYKNPIAAGNAEKIVMIWQTIIFDQFAIILISFSIKVLSNGKSSAARPCIDYTVRMWHDIWDKLRFKVSRFETKYKIDVTPLK